MNFSSFSFCSCPLGLAGKSSCKTTDTSCLLMSMPTYKSPKVGSATLLLLAFPGESSPNFPHGQPQLGSQVYITEPPPPPLKKKKKITKATDPSPHSDWQIRLSQSAPAHKQASFDRPAGCLSVRCSVNKARGRVVFENNGKMLWGCADRSRSLNTRDANTGVTHSACLSGRSYLAQGQ